MSEAEPGFQALVLAGSRGGIDPVAAYAGVSHKGLIELGGQTLLTRVLGALDKAGATRIGVSTSDVAIIDALAGHATATPLPAAGGPSQSVHDAASLMGTPLLVTTVDHALLQADWITEFLARAPADADIAVLMAPEAVVRAAAPETKRTYWRFKDGGYSGCNLFLLKTETALNAVAFWRKAEALRKQPWRIAALLGPVMLIRYVLGLMTIDETLERLGRAAGVRAAVVRSSYGLAAVDVDKPSDLDLVRTIVER
ncbi:MULTISPECIES: nucleotidyltransferase family protein [unclassified Caulobacter]|uniref:nucleotidyltransferase family protein n=1 Tax=unclassified Caulobacter TaxID=2648921 RepID=UPI000D34FD7E|nr:MULTISPECIES: nucleotidyltransferase family protein [unclassified Caulobacter]PTS88422.1 GTP--adenosylcobinamide-phosphate guanylyltransferase [Caulobacter sp. HMWF009]PTT07360.1 GTP--adenosylcobinamide-phosphate guanylyltransferase [Caulobacter sp. HMWF025]